MLFACYGRPNARAARRRHNVAGAKGEPLQLPRCSDFDLIQIVSWSQSARHIAQAYHPTPFRRAAARQARRRSPRQDLGNFSQVRQSDPTHNPITQA